MKVTDRSRSGDFTWRYRWVAMKRKSRIISTTGKGYIFMSLECTRTCAGLHIPFVVYLYVDYL